MIDLRRRTNYCFVAMIVQKMTNRTRFDLLVLKKRIALNEINLRMIDFFQLIETTICFDNFQTKNVVVAIDKYDFEIDKK